MKQSGDWPQKARTRMKCEGNIMKERPILFSSPMVLAILEGRKTQTRRVVKLNASGRVKKTGSPRNWHLGDPNAVLACPYGQPGDRLWVRETWKHIEGGAVYDADGVVADGFDHETIYRASKPHYPGPWKPSIHMPRWASRILLEIVSVRVERLQDISEADAKANGVIWDDAGQYWQPSEDINCPCCFAYGAYAELWESINGRESWDANPWVWVVEFRRGIS